MELIGFAIVLFVCLGIGKIINIMARRLVFNGAGLYLALFAAFAIWNIYLSWNSTLDSFQMGYALGRNITPPLIIALVATYFFFKFRTDKAHQLRVQKLRQSRAEVSVTPHN